MTCSKYRYGEFFACARGWRAGYVGFRLCAMVTGAYYVDNGRTTPQKGDNFGKLGR